MSSDSNPKKEIDKDNLVRVVDKPNADELQLTAQHAKITIPSNDLQQYDIFGPSPVPDTATQGVSITDLEYIFFTNPMAQKSVHIWANRIIGNGFDLLPSDEEGVEEEIAERAVEDCKKFLK